MHSHRPGMTVARSLHRQHAVIDLGDGVDPAQAHGGREFVADDVDRLLDSRAAESAETVNIGPHDHAGFGAYRDPAHAVLTGADAAVEHDFHLVADRVDDLG